MFCYTHNNEKIPFSFSAVNFCFHGKPSLATPGQCVHYITTQLFAVIADLYRLSGEVSQEEEECRQHTSFSKSLLEDHFQSSQLSEHALIQVRHSHSSPNMPSYR